MIGSVELRWIRGNVVEPRLPTLDVAHLFAIEARTSSVEKCNVESSGGQKFGTLFIPAAVARDAVQEHDTRRWSFRRTPYARGKASAVAGSIELNTGRSDGHGGSKTGEGGSGTRAMTILPPKMDSVVRSLRER